MTSNAQFLIPRFNISLQNLPQHSANVLSFDLNHHQGKLQVDDDLVKLKDSGW